jgi:hypothetical protein
VAENSTVIRFFFYFMYRLQDSGISEFSAEKNSIATCICRDGPADLPPLDGKQLTNFSLAKAVGEARGYIGFRDRPIKIA